MVVQCSLKCFDRKGTAVSRGEVVTEISRIITLIEKGRQLGVRKYAETGGACIAFIFAVQKVGGKYIVFSDEFDVDTYYGHELESTESITAYGTIEEALDSFVPKYGMTLSDLCPPKGSKYFDPDIYRGCET